MTPFKALEKKYGEAIGKLLGVPGEEISMDLSYSPSVKKPNDVSSIYIVHKKRFVGYFRLFPFPFCCGILISGNAIVYGDYRKKGLGTLLNKLRQDLAKLWGYSILVCTDIERNIPQRRILQKNLWKDAFSFKNTRTGNIVMLSYKEL